ncbi:MAG: GNAT family N-acetyltransferase [Alphaproteobacteria bacterium]
MNIIPIEVRLAARDDASLLTPLFQAMYADWGVEPPKTRDGLETAVADAMNDPVNGCEILIAVTGDACAGFAVFGEVFEPAYLTPGGFLRDIFVLPEYRRQGVGSALMQHLFREAQTRKWGSLDWHVNRLDFEARTFFEILAPDGYQVNRLVHRIEGEILEKLAYSGEVTRDVK